MHRFIPNFKVVWFFMLEPPWRQFGPDKHNGQSYHWAAWLIGWAWTLAGVLLGALIAPTFVRWVGLSNTQYQDWAVIAVALLAGILVQLLSFCWFAVLIGTTILIMPIPLDINDVKRGIPNKKRVVELLGGNVLKVAILILVSVVSVGLPLVSVGYGIYRYLTWVGAGQRSVTIAFVGALLVKAVLIPFIKGLVTGALFRWFMRWLLGDKVKTKGA